MSTLTFLTYEQIYAKNKLEILKRFNTRCAEITDFSTLLGGRSKIDYATSERRLTCDWWIKTFYYDETQNDTQCIRFEGGLSGYNDSRYRTIGARPVLPYSSISNICKNEQIINGIKEVEYGEYPQTITDKKTAKILEKRFAKGALRETGKFYTTDSVNIYDYNKKFQERQHIEYEFAGEKYIRFVSDYNSNNSKLSDGTTICPGKVYWIKVEPIKWLVDEKNDIALIKKIIFAGVQFNNKKSWKEDFDATDIKKFMDNYFSKDIIPSKLNYQTKAEQRKYLQQVKELLLNKSKVKTKKLTK